MAKTHKPYSKAKPGDKRLGNQFGKLADHSNQGKYNSAEELQTAIDNYFKNGVKIRKIVTGKHPNTKTEEIPVPTISGLCFFLGFASRQSFYDMEKKKELSYIIKRARLFIEQEYEERLCYGNVTGAIFALKNMGWVDKQEVYTTVKTIEEQLKELD